MSNRYRYIIDSEETPKKVIVLSKYAGKDVRGIAKCSPNDKFDIETGRVLATLRCGEIIYSLGYKLLKHFKTVI